jgi:hypothetical protein
MADKQPMQASGEGESAAATDGVNRAEAGGRTGGGESGGGAYRHDETSSDGGESAGFFGHGGQSRIDYHGSGKPDDAGDHDADDANAATGA